MYEATWTDTTEEPITATGRTKEEAVTNLQAKLEAENGDPPLEICGENKDQIGCGMYIVGHVRPIN